MKKVILKKINSRNISSDYVEWMNDWEIVKYTEQRYTRTHKKDILKYLNKINKSKENFIFGIFIKYNNKYIHIGNIKLGSINFNHKRADISYFVGDKKFQGKGIAKKAISEIILIAKKKFNLKKINAGVYSQNKASIKVLKSNGFKREAILKSHIIFNNKRYNSYIFGYIIK